MSTPSDDRPLAPPRSLGPPADASRAPAGQYVGAPSAYTRTDAPTPPGRPVPGPPPSATHPGASGPGQTRPVGAQQAHAPQLPTTVDKKRERRADRAAKRAEASRPRTVRRAKLRVVRLDPWSVTKASFLLSIAFGIMCVVAVFLVMSILSASGLWDNVNSTIQGLTNQKAGHQFDITKYVGMSRVMGITMLISAVDVVIITALATLGAFIYNMAASLLGGIEVTLAEDLR